MSQFFEPDSPDPHHPYDPRTAPGGPAPEQGYAPPYGPGQAYAPPPAEAGYGPGQGYAPPPAAPPGGPGYGHPTGNPTGQPAGAPSYGSAHPEPGYGYSVRAGEPHRSAPYDQGAPYDSGVPYGAGHGYGDSGSYVPEPMSGQLPSEVEPGVGFGMPAAGGAWAGGDGSAGEAHGMPPAAETWSAPPAAAHAWAAPPEPAYAAQQPAGYGAGAGFAAPEPAVERTMPFPIVTDLAEPGSGPAGPPPASAHRTGSPIIPPGIQPAGLTALLGLLMAGGAAVGKPGLAVVLVLLEAVTAAGWFRLNGMWPARQGIALAFLAGVTADVAVLAVNGGHGPVALLGTLGVWLLLVLVLQLRHHGSADERLSSLTATSASTLLTVVAAGYLATAASHAGTDPVVVGAVAVAAATLVRAVRLPGGEPASIVAALAVAAATGLLTGPATGFGGGAAALLGAVCGLCALVGLRVASYDWPSRFVHFTAGVALPLTAAAPAVYALGTLLS